MKQKKVYLSGKISGLTREEYIPRFMAAQKTVEEVCNLEVLNPAETLLSRWPWLFRIVGYRLTILYDLWLMLHCTHVYPLPGWKESRGSRIETFVAYQMGIKRLHYKALEKINKIMDDYDREHVQELPRTDRGRA